MKKIEHDNCFVFSLFMFCCLLTVCLFAVFVGCCTVALIKMDIGYYFIIVDGHVDGFADGCVCVMRCLCILLVFVHFHLVVECALEIPKRFCMY